MQTSRWCLFLFLLALLPRLLWAIAEHPLPFSDMEDYYLCAVNLLKGDYLAQSPDRLAYRAPGYPLFLALIIKVAPGFSLIAIRITQSLLGAGSCVFLFLITLKLIHARLHPSLQRYTHLISFIPGLVYAGMAYPIFFCSVLMTETLFVFLLLVWIYWGIHIDDKSSQWSIVGFSALLGILALIRPVALFLIPIVLWISFRSIPGNHRFRMGGLPFYAWLIPILPWTIRNAIVFHSLVLISSNSGVNFFIGNNPTFNYYESGYKETIRQKFQQQNGPDEVAEDRLFLRLGWAYVIQDPLAALRRCGWKLFFLYGLDKEPWPWEEYNRGQGLRVVNEIHIPTILWRPWFLLFSLLGVLYAFVKRIHQGLLLSTVGFYTLACLLFFARTRFRFPVEPLLTIYMVLGILALVETVVWGYGKRSNPSTNG